MTGASSDAIARTERRARIFELLTIVEKNPGIKETIAVARLMLKTGNRKQTVLGYLEPLVDDGYIVEDPSESGTKLWIPKDWKVEEQRRGKNGQEKKTNA